MALEAFTARPSGPEHGPCALISNRGMSGRQATIPAATGAAQYTVVYFDADGAQTSVLRPGAPHTVGRSDACDIVVKHATVSRNHAVIVGGQPPTIKDLGSSNGTRVSSRRITPHSFVAIEVGSLVQIGDVVLFVQRALRDSEAPPSIDGDEQTGHAPTPVGNPEAPPTHDEDLVVHDARSRELFRMARVVAASDLTVLVLGETGVGKERLAQAIHAASPRANRPLVSLNCAAFPETMVESELFGYERGAFTGAARPKPGLISAAEGGTLFLDEVGELTLPIQAKLLRVLESRELLPLGALKVRSVDIRILAATNRGLQEAVAAGRFREDLYYRLNGVTLEVPPLRERREDIYPLAQKFAQRFAEQLRRPAPLFSESAREAILNYAWPGNIRELKNVVQRATLLATSGIIEADAIPQSADVVDSFDAPELITTVTATIPTDSAVDELADSAIPGKRRVARPGEIMAALNRSGGDQAEAAKLLGVSRRTLINWLDKFDLPRPRKRPG